MGEATWGQVERAIDAVRGSLWLDGHSTQHGINDKVPESELHTIPDSLKLIKVANVRLIVAPEPGFNGRPPKRKVRASFRFNGISYLLALTDPILESEFLGKRNGTYDIGPATLCVSLSEPKFGFAFKLVATVLLKDRF